MKVAPTTVGAGLTGLLSGVVAACCVRLLGAAADAGLILWRRRDDLAFDELVLTGALGVLALSAGWLGVGLAFCAVAAARQRADGWAARVAHRLTPALCRRLVALLCGVAAVAGPTAVLPASGLESERRGARPSACPARTCAPASGLPLPDRPVPGVLAAGGPVPHRSPSPVRVRRGDTLWAIAAESLPGTATEADVAAAWPRWYAANRARIGPDPHLIRPGTRLRLPGVPSHTTKDPSADDRLARPAPAAPAAPPGR